MIPFDFEYCRPETIREAAEVYRQLDEAGKEPVYYSGGTELISMARIGNNKFGAVIDIKKIPECRTLDWSGEELMLGSALTLDEIVRSKQFPLLEKTAGRIADHTMQCKITLGGNLASSIIYRETVLPLLLADAAVIAAGLTGLRRYPIDQVFKERLQLPRGEFLACTAVSRAFVDAPYFHEKKTKNEKIDYPLLTTAALVLNGSIRIAFSGLAPYPFRDKGLEAILNDMRYRPVEKAEEIIRALSGITLEDMNGSAAYRCFVLKNTIVNIVEAIKEANISCLC